MSMFWMRAVRTVALALVLVGLCLAWRGAQPSGVVVERVDVILPTLIGTLDDGGQ